MIPNKEPPSVNYRAQLAALAEHTKAGRRALYQFAEVYDRVASQPDFNYDQLAKEVLDRHGVEIHSESSVSKLRKVYRHFMQELKIPLSEVEGISPYTLYELLRHANVGPDKVHDWLEKAKTFTRDELIRIALGKKDITPKLKTITMEENVYQMRKAARAKLSQAAGLPDMSETEYEEFMSGLISTTDLETLRELWDSNH